MRMRNRLPPDAGVDMVEQAFYDAMQRGDLQDVLACWSEEDDPLCLHPNGARLVGMAAIRDSFAELLQHGGVPLHALCVHRLSSGPCAIHSVIERVDVPTHDGVRQVEVWATNVYVRTAQGWRLCAHHASPAPTPWAQEADMPKPSNILH